jgi:hypothetical protein
LTKSADIGACLARKVVQYAFARPLASADDPLVAELTGRFASGGNRYKGFLAALAEAPWARGAGVLP